MTKITVEDREFARLKAIADLQMAARMSTHDPDAIVLVSTVDVRNSYHPERALSRWDETKQQYTLYNQAKSAVLLHADQDIETRTEYDRFVLAANDSRLAFKTVSAQVGVSRLISRMEFSWLLTAQPFFQAARFASRDVDIESTDGHTCVVRMVTATGMVCYCIGERVAVLKQFEFGTLTDPYDADIKSQQLLEMAGREIVSQYGEVAMELPLALKKGGVDIARIIKWSAHPDHMLVAERQRFDSSEDVLETILAACLLSEDGPHANSPASQDLVAVARAVLGIGGVNLDEGKSAAD